MQDGSLTLNKNRYYHKIIWANNIERGVIVINSVLTLREREVFELLIKNKNTKDIAEELDISEKTVRNHISNVILRLDVNGRTQAIIKLIQMKELKI